MAKTDKICIVCGKEFKGTAKAKVCGGNCRVKLKRLLAKGEKPLFELLSKSANINPTKKSKSVKVFDAPRLPITNKDEPRQYIEPRGVFINDAIRKKLGIT